MLDTGPNLELDPEADVLPYTYTSKSRLLVRFIPSLHGDDFTTDRCRSVGMSGDLTPLNASH